jgi:hypothetical protein
MNAEDLDQKTLDLLVDFLVWYTALSDGPLDDEQASRALDTFLAEYSTAT